MFEEENAEYEGQGVLKSEDGNIEIHIDFKAIQFFDGSIIIEFNKAYWTAYENFLEFYEKRFNSRWELEGEVCGQIKLNANNMIVTNSRIASSKNKPSFLEIQFKANQFKIKRKKFDSENLESFVKFGITNFKNFRTYVETKAGDFSFKKVNNYKKIIGNIKNYERPCLTSYAVLKNAKFKNALNHLSELEEEVYKVLTLSSLAQGTLQDWISFEIYDKSNDEAEIVYAKYKTPKSKQMSFQSLVHEFDLKNYLSKTYSNLKNIQLDKDDFYASIDWYLESIASDTLEPKFLNAFVCLELLVDRFARSNNIDFITDLKKYKNFFNKKVQPVLSDLLKNFGITDNNLRSEIYSGMEYSCRRSFINKLKILLEKYRIGYKDLSTSSQNILRDIYQTRNGIVHQGLANMNYDKVYQNYQSLMCLNQRILLSLLSYDYEGKILDWINNYNSIRFNRDPQNEYPYSILEIKSKYLSSIFR